MPEVIVKQATTDSDIEGLHALRMEVFVKEQGVSKSLEVDSLDALAYHTIAVVENDIVGTGRLLVLPDRNAVIGRMAVRADVRRIGIGKNLLEYLESAAAKMGVTTVIVHAQTYVTQFYLQNGYSTEGEPFEEAGIQHILMHKSLS